MDPKLKEVAGRIRALREDMEITPEEMAKATDMSVDEYLQNEAGEKDFQFTFLNACAKRLGVDIVEILTGESPHLRGYSLVRAGHGLSVKRHAGYEYLHVAPNFDDKLVEPFVVTIPYSDAEQNEPIPLFKHKGQEFDYVLSGEVRFAYEDHIEDLSEGDALLYDSGKGHGLIAIGGKPCKILAIVVSPDAFDSINKDEIQEI